MPTIPPVTELDDVRYLNMAARLAVRAIGDVEPNPLVGALIVSDDGQIIGRGWHRRFGDDHAEIDALKNCESHGHSPAGATMYVTLEPCNHHAKTPPCAKAVADAGIRRCVIARAEPTPSARGGAQSMQDNGVEVNFVPAPHAHRLLDSFAKREQTGLPWVLVKWATSLDGRIALPTGQSQWISNARSRSAVHRIRARMDAILTGIGTVLADDPQLTPRDVRNHRTNPKRIVVDPRLSIQTQSKLISTAATTPTIIATLDNLNERQTAHRSTLEGLGATVMTIPANDDGQLCLQTLLRRLVTEQRVTRLMVEAGGGLVGRLVEAKLIDELMLYVAPCILGGAGAHSPTRSFHVESMDLAPKLTLQRVRRIGDDVELNYRFRSAVDSTTPA